MMFLLEICLSSYKSRSLKTSPIKLEEGDDWQHWIDGWIEKKFDPRSAVDASENIDGVYNSIFLSSAQKSLMISNDPLGQRPLYFREVGGYLYVGSCFWDLMGAVAGDSSSPLNEGALECLLALRRIVPSHHTLHSEIFVLPAGAQLVKAGGSPLQLSHVVGMQQKPDKTISVHDAALELKGNMLKGLSRIKESGKFSWFWFGNSGGLDSRVIPALAQEVGLGSKGFLVSGDRVPGLRNLSKLGSQKVAEKYGIENRLIDYKSKKCTNIQRLFADALVNPFGPANYHKNPEYCDFSGSLVVNGGNSFLIANDNGSWKRYLGKGEGALNGYFSDILLRKDRLNSGLRPFVEETLRQEMGGGDFSDDFSVCRTLHQKYLNKTSPMGAFESMSWAGEFHYLYYSGKSTLYCHWPKELFFDRRVQKEFMGYFYPDLMNIADQGGNRPDSKVKKNIQRAFIAKVRGNGLNYGSWVRSGWFKQFVNDVNNLEFVKANPRTRSILRKLGEFSSAQDNLDMVKLASVVGMIEAGVFPADLSSRQ
jgi:hypothetical protein